MASDLAPNTSINVHPLTLTITLIISINFAAVYFSYAISNLLKVTNNNVKPAFNIVTNNNFCANFISSTVNPFEKALGKIKQRITPTITAIKKIAV